MRADITQKLNSTKGETLAETLVAILIVSLSTALFLGMISAASKIGMDGARADALFYKTMSLLENFEAEGEAKEAGSDPALEPRGGLPQEAGSNPAPETRGDPPRESGGVPSTDEQVRLDSGTLTVEAPDGSFADTFEVDIFYGNDMASYRLKEGGDP